MECPVDSSISLSLLLSYHFVRNLNNPPLTDTVSRVSKTEEEDSLHCNMCVVLESKQAKRIDIKTSEAHTSKFKASGAGVRAS